MTPEDLTKVSSDDILHLNKRLAEMYNHDLATIGAIWSEIRRRELWAKMGYRTLAEAVEAEGPRGYSMVQEAAANYDFYVRAERLSFDAYQTQYDDLGHRKMTYARQHYEETVAGLPPVARPETFLEESLLLMKTKSVKEAREAVLERRRDNGTVIERWIDKHGRLTEDQGEIWDAAVRLVIKLSGPATEFTAVTYALQEFLAIHGTKKIKK